MPDVANVTRWSIGGDAKKGDAKTIQIAALGLPQNDRRFVRLAAPLLQ